MLEFDTRNDPSFWVLDDGSVTAAPKPATLGLLGLGLAGAWPMRQRKTVWASARLARTGGHRAAFLVGGR